MMDSFRTSIGKVLASELCTDIVNKEVWSSGFMPNEENPSNKRASDISTSNNLGGGGVQVT